MSRVVTKIEYRYINVYRDRHGRERIYFRRSGEKRIPLRGPLGSVEFEQDYRAALGTGGLAQETGGNNRSYKWLCLQYFRSADFKRLDPGTQRTRQLILEHTWAEPISPGSAVLIGDCPLHRFTGKIIRVLRDRKMKLPHAANGRVKVLRRIFKWAMECELVEVNPARDVQYLKTKDGGYHTWSEPEIAQFEAHWPIGSKPRLAIALFRYLGVRRSDVVRIGKQHVRAGVLRLTTKKCPTTLELPLPQALQRIIELSPTGDLTFLTTDYGKPFTEAGFGGWFRERCDAAGLPQCSAHGLRKAAATELAEAGASAHQLMSWFGWKSLKEAERYTRTANQKKLAASVVQMFKRDEA